MSLKILKKGCKSQALWCLRVKSFLHSAAGHDNPRDLSRKLSLNNRLKVLVVSKGHSLATDIFHMFTVIQVNYILNRTEMK